MTPETIVFLSRCVVPLCVTIVLGAVALNFIAASGSGTVKWRQRSRVATASMLGVTFGVYLLIHQHIGQFQVDSAVASAALAGAGAALVVAGAIVNVLGRIRLGGNWANQVTVYEEQTLVRSGVFGLVRHPLYASLIWMFIGASLVYHNAAALAVTFLVFVPMMRYRAGQEELLLSRQFPEYAEYQNSVGRLFPRFWKGRAP